MKELDYKNRIVWMDLLRIFAAFCVVLIHVLWVNRNFVSISAFDTKVNYLLNAMVNIADPVFFMISGSMMLNKKKEISFSNIIKKRIPKLIIAFCFWSLIYSFVENIIIIYWHGGIRTGIVKKFLTDFITGYNHMWFIFALIFAYLAVPFLKKICEDKKAELLFCVLSVIPLIVSFINEFKEIEVINTVYDYFNFNVVTGYTIFFVIGHFLYEYDIPGKIRFIIYSLSFLSIVLSVVLNKSFSYMSLTNFFIAISVFLIFKYGISKIRFKENRIKFIVKISSLTFGTYLIHQLFVIALNLIYPSVEIKGFVNLFVIAEGLLIFTLSLISVFIISKIPILKKYII